MISKDIMRHLNVKAQSWPLLNSFNISRGSKTSADVVHVEIVQDHFRGQGECVPYRRYGESIESVIEQIEQMRYPLSHGMTSQELNQNMRPGAARNAIDCALWDLECKIENMSAWTRAGYKPRTPLITAFTISLDAPEIMAKNAFKASNYPLLKLKLGADDGLDQDRLHLIRKACPKTRLIVDANEGWSEDHIVSLLKMCEKTHIELVEQPLPEGNDEILSRIDHPVPICADESAHTQEKLHQLRDKYDWINVKLDKAGGLTAALETARTALKLEFGVMVGCMVGTSLAMAPALILAEHASLLDLDGPLWLEQDHKGGISYKNGKILTPHPQLWGNPIK